jgi:hypothetical protein
VAGQEFEYTFDDIGNRKRTRRGGDTYGVNLRTANYTANQLNQYTTRQVPGYVDVIGSATADSTGSVDDNPESISVDRVQSFCEGATWATDRPVKN